MQLVAYGVQDVYLTGNPQTTFFKSIHRKHTNFSMECVKVDFKGGVGRNSRIVAKLPRKGDLVHDCFIKVNSHELNGDTFPQNPGINQGNNPGHNMIDYIELEIGGQLIDKHYGHWMEAHAELTEESINSVSNTNSMQLGDVVNSVYGLTGKFQNTSFAGGVNIGAGDHTIPDFYVPLRFWFCRNVGLSLPLIALQYHKVEIIIKLTDTKTADYVDSLWCNYIYLDTDERRRFAKVAHEYLIEQVQNQTFTVTQDTKLDLKLNFNHPVKELIWGCLKRSWGLSNDQFTGGFKCLGSTSTLTGNDQWQLKLNGHDRFEKQSLPYFTRYQIYKYHTGIPITMELDCLAVYSFALKPEEHQPSGTCNFSRIDNSQLTCENYNGTEGTLEIYAVNYNVLRIMSGMGGLAYSN